MDISVVIAAYKEAENLKILLPKINEILSVLAVQYEILVIDAPETMDSSPEVCKANNTKYFNQVGSGYGNAVRTGISKSIGNKVLMLDADGSHDPEYIKEMYQYCDKYDLVIGSRYVGGGKTKNNIILILMSLIVNTMYRLFLNFKAKDVSTSFRLYDGQKVRSIDTICKNFDVLEEILLKLMLNYPDLKIKEIPIEFKKRIHGESKRELFKFILSYLVTMQMLIRMKWSFRKNIKPSC